jgi:hypothetical protein
LDHPPSGHHRITWNVASLAGRPASLNNVHQVGAVEMSAVESELRDRLGQLIKGQESLRVFQAWFVPAFWDDESLDLPLQRLAHEVELVISEHTSGAWSWSEAKALLQALLGFPVVEAEWGGGFPRIVTGTTSKLIRRSRVPEGPEAFDLQPAGIRYEAAHG